MLVALIALMLSATSAATADRPNIILCMADDQGWGDTAYNGHPYLKTPNLDAMSAEGITFTRFYSAAAMCSPTRGSCYTGRNPYRFGVTFAMKGMLEPKEVPITTVLKQHGYTTGHFGKWHLGTLSRKQGDQKRWGPLAKILNGITVRPGKGTWMFRSLPSRRCPLGIRLSTLVPSRRRTPKRHRRRVSPMGTIISQAKARLSPRTPAVTTHASLWTA